MKQPNKSIKNSRSGQFVSRTDEKSAKPNVTLLNGRLISRTLADPEVKQEVEKRWKPIRADKQKLLDFYVKAGLLTKGGKLTKAYGG